MKANSLVSVITLCRATTRWILKGFKTSLEEEYNAINIRDYEDFGYAIMNTAIVAVLIGLVCGKRSVISEV